MRKEICSLICLTIILCPGLFFGEEKPTRFSDIQPDLDAVIAKLSSYISIFEDITNKMDASAKASQNYSEQKNIFLSSQLAITTIAEILEYNRDLLVLFGDLREKNRKKFYTVRIESLETSVQQINNMHRQIQINYTILPSDFFEPALLNMEREVILSSVASMETCVQLLKSVNRK